MFTWGEGLVDGIAHFAVFIHGVISDKKADNSDFFSEFEHSREE
jgi:hypothetical protein